MRVAFTGYTRTESPTNFPALVAFRTNLVVFAYHQFFSAAGNDLRFSDEIGIELKYEIDTWNTGGSSFVWVQVPQLERTRPPEKGGVEIYPWEAESAACHRVSECLCS